MSDRKFRVFHTLYPLRAVGAEKLNTKADPYIKDSSPAGLVRIPLLF